MIENGWLYEFADEVGRESDRRFVAQLAENARILSLLRGPTPDVVHVWVEDEAVK